MKLFLLSICLCLAVATAVVPRRTRNREQFSKKDEQLLKLASNKRVFKDEQVPMKSARLTKDMVRPKVTPRHADVEVKNFQTRLDHLTPTDQRTVDFQYFLKKEYFINDMGGIFIYINDGDVFTTEFLETGLMHDIAIDTYSALVTADLRYFRNNLPTENATVESLRFLSSEQMVHDIGELVEEVRDELDAPDANVILWGTGHGAALATWARREFPDLIQGVWSSSGVYNRTLWSHDPYLSLSETIREIGGDECAEDVANAFIEFEYLIRTYEWFFVEDSLDLCIFIWDFYDEEMAIASHGLVEMIQHYFEVYHFHGVRNFCADIQSNGREEAFDAFARWVRWVFTDRTCLEFDYYQRIYLASHEEWEDIQELSWEGVDIMYPFQSRPSLYHRCTELANLPLTVNSDSLFGRLIQQEFWFLYCSESFYGNDYDYTELDDAVAALNARFGGTQPRITNAIYTNGELDPYVSFGISEAAEDDTHVFNIPLHFKSADLHSISAFDSQAVREVKEDIVEIITRWVNE